MPAPTPLYLPYEYTSTSILVSNVNPFGIDPEQTTRVLTVRPEFLLESGYPLLLESGSGLGLEPSDAFNIDPELTTLVTTGNVNAFDIDPELTTLVTT